MASPNKTSEPAPGHPFPASGEAMEVDQMVDDEDTAAAVTTRREEVRAMGHQDLVQMSEEGLNKESQISFFDMLIKKNYEIADLKREVKNREATIVDLQHDVAGIQARLDHAEEIERDLTDKIAELTRQLDEARAQ